MPSQSYAPLIIFDGYCALCNRSVAFLQARQRPGSLEFAAQHSVRGQSVLQTFGLADLIETVVLVENDRYHQRSTAALRALRYLRFPWPLLSAFLLVPPFLRDPVYNLIAHHRTRWFWRSPHE
jgi:predicted DCC family thiol-disulfide oxidoreductase YuxK